jgi:hypothetical protein
MELMPSANAFPNQTERIVAFVLPVAAMSLGGCGEGSLPAPLPQMLTQRKSRQAVVAKRRIGFFLARLCIGRLTQP